MVETNFLRNDNENFKPKVGYPINNESYKFKQVQRTKADYNSGVVKLQTQLGDNSAKINMAGYFVPLDARSMATVYSGANPFMSIAVSDSTQDFYARIPEANGELGHLINVVYLEDGQLYSVKLESATDNPIPGGMVYANTITGLAGTATGSNMVQLANVKFWKNENQPNENEQTTFLDVDGTKCAFIIVLNAI